ncbi:hypothetical protein M9H77_18835 [Catharanthus roseus]|uniref:Uncharacterized protein n=1 Tax=Catharanthus roseus TaxID=4058 RepID=A0ACC0B8Q7_CATRO|nr:hypothetical protein M9H77_18835 [Catharanthus roseus]
MNRTIMDKVRYLLVSSGVPKPFWKEAVSTAAYLINGEGKLDPRSKKGVFIGYPSGVKGYRVWLRGEPGVRVVVSGDVVFNKLDMPCLRTETKLESAYGTPVVENILVEVEVTSEPSHEHTLEPELEPETNKESSIPEPNELILGDSDNDEDHPKAQAQALRITKYRGIGVEGI